MVSMFGDGRREDGSAERGGRAAARRARQDRGPQADPAHRVLDGRYELLRLLGSGGEADVHLAQDRVLQREVAVKLFRRGVAVPSERRLEQIEARVSATLNHYALTTLFDVGVDAGAGGEQQLYLVMEYVPGESLHTRLRRGPMTAADVCWMGFDLAEGLDSMHMAGFLHRDVKPGNILLSGARSVRPVVAKLTDFGIAAAVGAPDFSEFTVGTAAYLSPEQVEGQDARPESDVYSLGLVLLEAITGRVAFPGSVTVSAFDRLSRDPEVPDSVPERTAALLRRMTARAPGDRISLFDAAVELQQILVDDLVRQRGAAAGLSPVSMEPEVLHNLTHQARPGLDAALRLAAAATDSPKAVLLLHEAGRGASVAASLGWTRQPLELEQDPIDPPSARAVADGFEWAVPDLLRSSRLKDHPVTQQPHGVRSAAGTRLITVGGNAVGTLLVCDDRPREYSEGQLAALRDAAVLVARDIELRLAVRRALFPTL